MHFEELKSEMQDLKDAYLRPILQIYQNIEEALKEMKSEVNKNCENITKNANDILNLRKELDELKGSCTAKPATHFASIGDSVDGVARELNLRNKNKKQLYVKAANKKAATDVLHEIAMKEVAVENIIELPNPLKDREDSFIIELQTPKDVRDVLMKKNVIL